MHQTPLEPTISSPSVEDDDLAGSDAPSEGAPSEVAPSEVARSEVEAQSFDPTLLRPGQSRLLDFLLENFVRANPLFLFSAGALLLGAWLLNPPGGDGARSLPLLLQLFGVVQVYEFALLGAAALLAKRGARRDVRGLLLVLGPFLLDVTFTSGGLCALLQQNAGWAPALTLVALNLSVAWLKLHIGLRLVGQRLSPSAMASLALGPLLVGLTPLVGLGLAAQGMAHLTSLVTGGGLALLVACLAASAEDATLRRLAPLALVGVGVHALSTAWVYGSPISWTLAPSALVLGVAAPRLFPALVPYRRGLALAFPAAAVVLGAEWGGVSAAQWRPILVGAALVQCVALRQRPGELVHWLALALALDLAFGGGSAQESLRSLGGTPFEPSALLIASGVSLARRTSPALTLSLAGAGVVLGLGQVELAPHVEAVLAIQALGALSFVAGRRLAQAHPGAQARHLRLAGALAFGLTPALTLVWIPGEELVVALSRVAGLILILAAWRLRSSLLAGAALPAGAELLARLTPSSSAGWGVASLALAFGLVAAGIGVSLQRDRLLELLRHRGALRRDYRPETLSLPHHRDHARLPRSERAGGGAPALDRAAQGHGVSQVALTCARGAGPSRRA